MSYFIYFDIFVSSVHDKFMWVVHDIFHDISEIKGRVFCWGIHVSNDTHVNILKIVVSLNSDVHDATKPVIKGSSIWVLNLLQILSINRCIQ